MASKSNKKSRSNRFIASVIFLIALAVIFGVSFIWTDQINNALKLTSITQSEFGGKSIEELNQDVESGGDSKSLQVHFVDVGQGDACIIEFPNDTKMIIDGGKDKEKAKLLDYIENNIGEKGSMAKSKETKGYAFDYAILTHSDEDHCGGLDDVLNTYAAKVFYRPNEEATRKGFKDPAKIALKLSSDATLKDTLAYKNVIETGYNNSRVQYVTGAKLEGNVIEPVKTDASVSDDEFKKSDEYFKFEFFTPIKNSYKDFNDYSPVMILTYMGKTIVMSGDAEVAAEAEFVAAAKTKDGKYEIFDESFNADVIKLGHHGSKTSSSEEYLKALTNESLTKNVLAVISCGFGNSYKHPHEQTLDRLTSLGFKEENVLRTDKNSSIVLAVANVEGTYQLLSGANVVRTEKATVAIGGVVNIQWRELCITVWVIIAAILIIKPTIDYFKKSKRKYENASAGTKKNNRNKPKKK